MKQTVLFAISVVVFTAVMVIMHPNKDNDIQHRYQLTTDGSVHYTELDTKDSIILMDFTIPKIWLAQFDSTYSDRNYKLIAGKFMQKAYTSYLFDRFTFYGNYAMPIMLILFIASYSYKHYRNIKYYDDEQKRQFRNGLIELIVIMNAAWCGWNIFAHYRLIDSSLISAGEMIYQASLA